MEPTLLEKKYKIGRATTLQTKDWVPLNVIELLKELQNNLHYYLHSRYLESVDRPAVLLDFTFRSLIGDTTTSFVDGYNALLRLCLYKFHYILKSLIGKLKKLTSKRNMDSTIIDKEATLVWNSLFKYLNVGFQYSVLGPQKKIMSEWNELEIQSLHLFTIMPYMNAVEGSEKFNMNSIPDLHCLINVTGKEYLIDVTLTTFFNYEIPYPILFPERWKLIIWNSNNPIGAREQCKRELDWISGFHYLQGWLYNDVVRSISKGVDLTTFQRLRKSET